MDGELGSSSHQQLLKRHGYDVVTAATEREGFSVLRDNPVDAVILSLEVAGIAHRAAVRRMKEMKPHVPVLLVSRSASVLQFPAADAVVQGDPPSRLPAALAHLLNVRFPFFTRWFGNWRHRA
jgi:DNA-binding NtrC family response regulator